MTVMGMPSLSTAQIAQISALVAGYIGEQSERFVGRAAGIAPNLRVPVNGFFYRIFRRWQQRALQTQQ